MVQARPDHMSNKRLFCKHKAAVVLSSCPRGRDFSSRGQAFTVQPLMDIQYNRKGNDATLKLNRCYITQLMISPEKRHRKLCPILCTREWA